MYCAIQGLPTMCCAKQGLLTMCRARRRFLTMCHAFWRCTVQNKASDDAPRKTRPSHDVPCKTRPPDDVPRKTRPSGDVLCLLTMHCSKQGFWRCTVQNKAFSRYAVQNEASWRRMHRATALRQRTVPDDRCIARTKQRSPIMHRTHKIPLTMHREKQSTLPEKVKEDACVRHNWWPTIDFLSPRSATCPWYWAVCWVTQTLLDLDPHRLASTDTIHTPEWICFVFKLKTFVEWNVFGHARTCFSSLTIL